MPAEHGGWGLTLEPGLLALLVAPSLAGLALAIAAVAAFLVRTPLRLVLIDRRHRRQGRPSTAPGRVRLAARVAIVELALLGLCVGLAAMLAVSAGWWLPGLAGVPFFGVALWYDARGRSRELLPEVAGSVAVASIAAMGALAGGAGMPLALGLWLIQCARVASSVPHVRAQVLRIHGRAWAPSPGILGDAAALTLAAAAVLGESSLALGLVAIVGLVAVQRVTLTRPPRPAKVLGVRQMALGFAVVGVTAVGVAMA